MADERGARRRQDDLRGGSSVGALSIASPFPVACSLCSAGAVASIGFGLRWSAVGTGVHGPRPAAYGEQSAGREDGRASGGEQPGDSAAAVVPPPVSTPPAGTEPIAAPLTRRSWPGRWPPGALRVEFALAGPKSYLPFLLRSMPCCTTCRSLMWSATSGRR